MRWSKIFFILAATFVFAAAAPSAQAIGLSVAPRDIFLEGEAGRPAAANFTVTNTSDGVALFEAYPDDLRSMIEIAPARFTLESGEAKIVALTLRAAAAGKLETMVSVTANPISADGLQAGAGIKIRLRANIAGGPAGLMANISSALGAGALPVGAVLLALAVFLKFFKITPRKKKPSI